MRLAVHLGQGALLQAIPVLERALSLCVGVHGGVFGPKEGVGILRRPLAEGSVAVSASPLDARS